MPDLDRSAAPGCYGIGLLFKEGSNECNTCPFAKTCGPIAVEQLARLREEMGITVKEKPPVVARTKAESTVSPTRMTTGLPKKVAELVERLENDNVQITEPLSRGENPFATRPAFLRVACHILIKKPEGVDRNMLCAAFMRALNWSKGTADAHVIQTVQALRYFGAADESNGTLTLRRAA